VGGLVVICWFSYYAVGGLTSDLAEDYHIIAYRWIFSYFLQKYDIVHLNSKKRTIGLDIYQNITAENQEVLPSTP
jgi:hypothetical protein